MENHDNDVVEEIRRVFNETKNKGSLFAILRDGHPELLRYIVENTKFLEGNPKERIQKDGSRVPFIARVVAVMNGISEQPKCVVCGKNAYYKHHLHGFSKWCSIKCSVMDEDTQSMRKDTLKSRYGEKCEKIVEKSRKTRFEKYGSYSPSDFGEKVKKTKLANHGDENFVNLEKAKSTKLERYGDENYVNVEKNKATKAERYGDANYNNRKKFKETIDAFSEERRNGIKSKRRDTCLERYGVDSVKKLKFVNDKARLTTLDRHGVGSSLCIAYIRSRCLEAMRKESYDFMLMSAKNDGVEMLNPKEDFLNAESFSDFEFRWKCLRCGHEFKSRYDNGHCVRMCPNCGEDYSKKEQYELYSFLKSIVDDEISVNDRTAISPLELDFYIPSKKLAVEFDGLFWHNENHKPRAYHLKKTEMCGQCGIRLVHVFEDEWRTQKNIVKSRLRSMLCGCRTIYARKCEVVEIDSHVKNRFLEKYHMQGKDVSAFNYALSHNGHVVAVMTFAKSRFSKDYEYELSRYATVSHFRIVGGAGKLLKHFEKTVNPKSLVTYADRRWSIGNLYFSLGFKHIRNSAPSYYYIKNNLRQNRMLFQKHKLKTLFSDFDSSKSEHEIMNDHGYYRIYDCGNMVFAKTY